MKNNYNMFDEFPELDYPRFAKDNSPTQHINQPKKNLWVEWTLCGSKMFYPPKTPTQHINQPTELGELWNLHLRILKGEGEE